MTSLLHVAEPPPRHRPRPGASARRLASLGAACAAALLLGGCVNEVSGDAIPAAIRSTPFCLERVDNDHRRIGDQIAEQMNSLGASVRVEDAGGCRDGDPYRVVYRLDWSWDMRTFLSRLTIEVIDNATRDSVAFGESHQTSLASLGKSHRDVINRAVAELLEME